MLTLLESVNEVQGLALDQLVTWNNLEEGLRNEEIKYLFTEDEKNLEKSKENFLKKAMAWFKEQLARIGNAVQNAIAKLTLKLTDGKKVLKNKKYITSDKTVRVSSAFANWGTYTKVIAEATRVVASAAVEAKKGNFDAKINEIAEQLKTVKKDGKGLAGSEVQATKVVGPATMIINSAKNQIVALNKLKQSALAGAKEGYKAAKSAIDGKLSEKAKAQFAIVKAYQSFVMAVSKIIASVMSIVISAYSSAVSVFKTSTEKVKKEKEEKVNENADLFTLNLEEDMDLDLEEDMDLDLEEEDLFVEELDLDEEDMELELEEDMDLDLEEEDLFVEELDLDLDI